MGYKEKVLEELRKGMFTVKELVKRLDDPVHLNSRTVSTYVKRLLKEDKIIGVLDEKRVKYITVDLYCYKYIANKVAMWKDKPKIHEFITNFALNILQLKGDDSLSGLKNLKLLEAIEKVPFDKKYQLYS